MGNRKTWPVIENRRARHDYEILDTVECGISLRGNEVKSLRTGKGGLAGAWCSVDGGTLVLHGMHIARHDTSNAYDVDEKRDRVLLAHKREIQKMRDRAQTDGMTLVPLKAYWSRQYCKLLVGICRGKHTYDKRETLKRRDQERDMRRAAR